MTIHPAALVLDEHIAPRRSWPSEPTHCECGWRGADCDYPVHLADVLDRAGLLKDTTVTAYLEHHPYTCRTCGAHIEGLSAPAGRKVTPESALLPIAPVVLSAVPCGHVIPEDQLAAMSRTTPTWPTT